ncbi:MAG: polysaccharide deacetylase [Frankiales bacterium]|nr:polysaccharide deacetylase [Frankiales bacterium]
MLPTRRSVLLAAAAAALAGCSRSTPDAAPAPARPTPSAPLPSPSSSPSPSPSPTPAGPVREVDRGPGTRPEVALTFHGAGDPALGTRLLEQAERGGAAVTVLAVGTWLQTTPALAERVLSGGHELGNHTMTHPTMKRLGRDAVAEEIGRCRDLLQRLTGSPGAHFRPSGGSGSNAVEREEAGRSGYDLLLGFDVDPRDHQDPGADLVVSRTLSAVRAGSIVSLHLGHPGTVTALPRLLDGLRRKGLTPVTASRLLQP